MVHIKTGYTQKQMNEAKQRDIARAATRGEFKRIGKSGRLHMQVDQQAFLNAFNQEGREVMGPAGKGYWEDMKRRHPHLDTMPDKGVRHHTRRTRFGNSSFTKVYG